ncbi:Hypothetical predicted protein [Paramuricea clavata]|uniref:Uncharacterized protein n=1 Tax=Paramuricea clavata TaxID=317549 RepID=A0A6S7IFP5_PARCT|nr:Hypothetical predicted protein [Paramuricea clavata]
MASKKTEGQGNFTWTDDKIELLLAVIYEYKNTRYPRNQDADDQREFPLEKGKNPSEELTKERVVAKIKALRLKCRKALDSGRKSGGGRVVAQFYDICSKIWSGSPAAEAIEGGIDSSLTSENTTTETTNDESSIPPEPVQAPNDAMSNDESETSTQGPDHHRRDLVKHLQESRNAKLKKKIPVDKQILDITKKDFELKREMMEHMKHMEAEHNKQMKTLSESMVGLTNALTAAIAGRQYQPQPNGQFQQHVQPGAQYQHPIGSQYQQPVQYMQYGSFQPSVINQIPQQQPLQPLLNHAQITELDYQMEQGGDQHT